jgi:hypothetical protein
MNIHRYPLPRIFLAAAMTLAAAASQATVVIDDFSTGRNWFGIDSASPAYVRGPAQAGSGMLCGSRETWLTIGYGPSGTGLFVESMVGAGALNLHADAGQAYSHSVIYGSARLLNADLSAEKEFSLNFRHITHPLKLTVYAVTQGGSHAAGGSAINIDIEASAAATNVKIPFAAFHTNHSNNTPVTWAEVDWLSFVFSSQVLAPQSFSLESIEATGSPQGVLPNCRD